LLLFLPLTALVAAPLNLLRHVWDAASAPARLWRRLTGRKDVIARGRGGGGSDVAFAKEAKTAK
jgi:hypothetical protein